MIRNRESHIGCLDQTELRVMQNWTTIVNLPSLAWLPLFLRGQCGDNAEDVMLFHSTNGLQWRRVLGSPERIFMPNGHWHCIVSTKQWMLLQLMNGHFIHLVCRNFWKEILSVCSPFGQERDFFLFFNHHVHFGWQLTFVEKLFVGLFIKRLSKKIILAWGGRRDSICSEDQPHKTTKRKLSHNFWEIPSFRSFVEIR